MRFFVLVSSLLITGIVHAAPVEAPDEIGKLLADKPVLKQIQQAGQTVSTKASALVVNALVSWVSPTAAVAHLPILALTAADL